MGTKERRERVKSETRDKILDAARQLFTEEGYEGVSMRKVAEKIEYSPTAIYVHFEDKEDLFHELCLEDFGRLATVFQSGEAPADAIERIRYIGQLYVDFGTQFPNHYKLMFMTPHPAAACDDRDEEIKGDPEKDAYAFLRLTVQEAIDEGRFREEVQDADLVAQTLWAAVHGVISLHIAKCNDGWVDFRPLAQRTALMLASVLYGIVKEAR